MGGIANECLPAQPKSNGISGSIRINFDNSGPSANEVRRALKKIMIGIAGDVNAIMKGSGSVPLGRHSAAPAVATSQQLRLHKLQDNKYSACYHNARARKDEAVGRRSIPHNDTVQALVLHQPTARLAAPQNQCPSCRTRQSQCRATTCPAPATGRERQCELGSGEWEWRKYAPA